MTSGTKAASWAGVVLASVALHAVAFGGLGQKGRDAASRKRAPATVEMTVAPSQVPHSPAEPPRPAVPRPRLAMARPAAKVHAAHPSPPATEPPAAAETLADFTGQTLTNDGPGPSWSTATGNGQRMNGPVGRPGEHVTHRVVEGTRGAPAADRQSLAWATCRRRPSHQICLPSWLLLTRQMLGPRG